jgi:hypothetical protein
MMTLPSETDEKKTLAQLKHGLNDWLAVGVTVAEHINAFNQGETNQYHELSLLGAFPGISLALNSVSQQGRGSANLLSGQTRLGDIAVSFSTTRYDDFISDKNISGRIESEHELRLSGQFNPFNNFPISFNFTAQQDEAITGVKLNTFDTLLGFQFYGGRMTIGTDFSKSTNANQRVTGSTSYTRVAGYNVRIRSDLNYTIKPKSDLRSFSSSISWLPTRHVRTQLGYTKDLTDVGSDSMDLTASYLMDAITLSGSTSLTEGGSKSVALTAEFSLGHVNKGQWAMSGDSQSQAGRVRARAFLDQDNDGLYSNNDTLLSGVGFKGRNSWNDIVTDDEGIAVLDNLSADFLTGIEVDGRTLADAYWVSKFQKSNVVSHAGALRDIDIPIAITVEAEGLVTITKQGRTVAAPGIPLIVTDAEGVIVKTAVTEFDGYYVITGLFPGQYAIEIAPDALKRFKVESLPALEFFADPEEGVVYLDEYLIK